MEVDAISIINIDLLIHDWKEDYTRQSQPPARGAPLGKQRLVV
jgi:hypothetical protein